MPASPPLSRARDVARKRAARKPWLALAALVLGWSAAAGAAERCYVEPETLLESAHRLNRTSGRIAAGLPIKIVALGSSSTEGVGASAPAHAYPQRMEAILARMLPRSDVVVLNRGVGGQEARDMIARLDRDVVEERPDLVIWQSGTNGALREQDISAFVEDLFAGVRKLQAAGIDVVLMGPQKSPRVDRAHRRSIYAQHLQVVAETARVPYLSRYELMAGWVARGQMTMDEMIDPDGLHMTDLSYGCLAEATARMIVNLSAPPIAQR